ncbi:MAG TPA: hypothetical protein VMF60_09700, partial [Acidimicrobiales bacterium]|nr:hypothetical protein [Acidimicrobiales bacterium]
MTAVLPIVVMEMAGITAAPGTAAGATQGPLTPAEARTLSADVTDKVIVVFKNQLPSTPDSPRDGAARNAAVATMQAPVLGEMRTTKARDVKSIELVNAISATVSPGEARRLAANPSVSEVVKDEPVPLISSVPTVGADGAAPGGTGLRPLRGACPPDGQVQLDPQAVETIGAASQRGTGHDAQALGYTGAGVKVAFIADGLDIKNPDFTRPDGQRVFVDYQDFSGTGTEAPTSGGEAFLDASSIAAQGRVIYDISDYGIGLSRPCDLRILGVAPGASLVGLDVFGSSEVAFDSVLLEAIDYAVSVDDVNVLNESFGANPFPDEATLDLTRMADEAAVAAGVTVVAGTGDAGVTDTIGSPATDPAVISAGATTTYRAYAQTGVGGINRKGVKGWLDNNISDLSSSGFAQDGSTVDVVAPGDLNWALCTAKPRKYAACTDFAGKPASVELTGGTSEAAPLTSGTAALVIQSFAEAHGGTDPTPAVVKQIIMSTATDIDAPADQQGAGLVDAYAAVLAARSYPGSSSGAAGRGLLESANQFHATASPATPETLDESVTNDGKGTATVGLSSRTLGAYTSVKATAVTLSDATGDAAVVQFTVPSGQARLDGAIAYAGPNEDSTDLNSRVELSLFSPSHKLAEYNLPQGTGNFSDDQVANPQPGTWTALVFGPPSSEGGTTGPVQFGASVAAWRSFGTLSQTTLTLAPGATSSFSLTVPTPSAPGDQSGSIVLSDGTGARAVVTTVPVTLRATVPTPNPSTTFTGTLTGGNGRAPRTGQTAYYQVQVPAGLSALNAQVTVPDVHDTFLAQLVDPTTGEAASSSSNSLYTAGSGGSLSATLETGAQLHVLDPDPGLWTLVVDFYNQVAGTAVSRPFTVTLDRTPVTAKSSLPDSAASTLAAGTPVKATVTVANHGNVPEEYFVDARLDTTSAIDLVGTNATQPVPLTGVPPSFLVPSHTTSITAGASASAPIFFDFAATFGDPDLISESPPFSTNPTGTFSSSFVASGDWTITPLHNGPDGRHG